MNTSVMSHKSFSLIGRLVDILRRGKEYQKETRERILEESMGMGPFDGFSSVAIV